MVAAGRVDAFTTLNISPWDVAAGVLCAEEAGGKVTDFHGEKWTLNKTDLVVSNTLVHEEVLAILHDADVPQPQEKLASSWAKSNTRFLTESLCPDTSTPSQKWPKS